MSTQNNDNIPNVSNTSEYPESEYINPQVAEVLKELPEAKRELVIQAIRQESFSGPIPHPELLKGYESIQQGFAERIVRMAEKQQDHRSECENKVVEGAITEAKRGQNYALIISLFFGVASVALGLLGHDWLAGVLGGGTLVSLVTIFVTGRHKKD